jgi:fatty acid synthase subunit alpha, fungi type
LSFPWSPVSLPEPHIKKTNIHLPANSQLHVSLHNRHRVFVLTVPARTVYGLVTNLRKVRAPSGTLNSLYINLRQFTFQLPLWQEMRKEGLPIEGFCVAAGIPSTEKAVEIIDGLRQVGIKHVAFKPGSVEGIRQVVSIAATNPNFPIILQWTGGRAAGHHSYEDFHQLILATYSSIRQHSNISLIAGFGAEDIWPYLTGDWAVQAYGVQPIPFDGFLFASRVMVAKEAHTSSSVKDLIVAAPGVDDGKAPIASPPVVF